MEKEFLRREEESVKQYKIRLCKNKDLYGLNWQDIADLINEVTGDKWGESKYRKWYYSYKEGYEDAIVDNTNSDEVMEELEMKKAEFYKEKVKYQDQKREFHKILRETARVEHIKDEIQKSVMELSKIKPLEVNYVGRKETSNKEGVLLISDWHKGLFAKNYWNNFDDEEFYKRVSRLTRKTIEYGLRHDINTLNVFLLGDLVNGIIRTTTRLMSTEDVITQTQRVSECISEMLFELSCRFSYIKVYSARGNHDRVTPAKEESLSKESFADIISWYLKARLSHIDNIEIIDNEYDDEIIVAEVCGYTIFGTHGNHDKVSNVVENLTLMIKKFPQYIAMGHTHHLEENETHGVEVIVNPTLSGVDEYSKDLRLTSKPSQRFMVFDKKEGRECTYNIRLDIN